MREFDLLKHIYASTAASDSRVLIGPGDDMALVRLNGRELLAAVDQVVDGRHFRLDRTPLELIGRKAVTRSLSDIAAMAGVPVSSLAAATLPPDFGQERANQLFDAMRATAQQYGCPLVGGDIAFYDDASHPLVCSVTVLAEPTEGRVVTRSGARAGDRVFVTGRLGGSMDDAGLGRHLTFEPRINEAQRLVTQLGDRLHAMIDISDGLGRDASHIAEMSGVQIRLDAARIPCNPGCDWRRALSDGEDYELCLTVDAHSDVPADCSLYEVGTVAAARPGESAVVIVDGERVHDGGSLGWQHES